MFRWNRETTISKTLCNNRFEPIKYLKENVIMLTDCFLVMYI